MQESGRMKRAISFKQTRRALMKITTKESYDKTTAD